MHGHAEWVTAPKMRIPRRRRRRGEKTGFRGSPPPINIDQDAHQARFTSDSGWVAAKIARTGRCKEPPAKGTVLECITGVYRECISGVCLSGDCTAYPCKIATAHNWRLSRAGRGWDEWRAHGGLRRWAGGMQSVRSTRNWGMPGSTGSIWESVSATEMGEVCTLSASARTV